MNTDGHFRAVAQGSAPFAYILNDFTPAWQNPERDQKWRGFDKRTTHAFVLTDQNAVNRVATATYLIEFNNLARQWKDVADDVDTDQKNRMKDIATQMGLNDDRPKVGRDTPRMTVWDKQDLQDVPNGHDPKFKNDIRYFWIDGEHPNRVSSSEDADSFRKYWNGEKDFKPIQKRQVSKW
jgi:hypothetical protein